MSPGNRKHDYRVSFILLAKESDSELKYETHSINTSFHLSFSFICK